MTADSSDRITISRTCQVRFVDEHPNKVCGEATVAGYSAMGGGYMALCREHAKKHASITQSIEDILAGIPHPDYKEPPPPKKRGRPFGPQRSGRESKP